MTPKEIVVGALAALGAYHGIKWLAGDRGVSSVTVPWEAPTGALHLEEADAGDKDEGVAFYLVDDEGRGFGDVLFDEDDGEYCVKMNAAERYGLDSMVYVTRESDILPAAEDLVEQIEEAAEAE